MIIGEVTPWDPRRSSQSKGSRLIGRDPQDTEPASRSSIFVLEPETSYRAPLREAALDGQHAHRMQVALAGPGSGRAGRPDSRGRRNVTVETREKASSTVVSRRGRRRAGSTASAWTIPVKGFQDLVGVGKQDRHVRTPVTSSFGASYAGQLSFVAPSGHVSTRCRLKSVANNREPRRTVDIVDREIRSEARGPVM